MNSPPGNKRRSRRLQKKLHIGAFKEEGFEVGFRWREGVSDDEMLDVLTRFITEVVESRGLAFGGGENGFITRVGRGSTTDDDRRAVSAWLLSCTAMEQVRVGVSEDAWYGTAGG